MKIKKYLVLISMLAVTFSLSACDDKTEAPFDYDEQQIVLDTMEYFTTYLNVDDDYADYYLSDGTEFEQSAVKGIQQARTTDNVGDFEDYSNYNDSLTDGTFSISDVGAEITESSDSITVTVINKAENRDVEVSIKYVENSEYYIQLDKYLQSALQYYSSLGYTVSDILSTSGYDTLEEAFGIEDYLQESGIYPYQPEEMVVTAVYSTSELMKQAGLNTALGMGTVFVVLIFISFIISLFKFLPALLAKKPKMSDITEKSEEAKTAQTSGAAKSKTSSDGGLMNDKELVAVITAAVYAAAGTSGAVSKDRLVVRSIKRARR